MKQLILLLVILPFVLSYSFEDYVAQFNKTYGSSQETTFRKQIFEANYSLILEINSQNLGYTLAPNHLTDRTYTEVEQLRGYRPNLNQTSSSPDFVPKTGKLLSADSINWNTSGKVTSVKSQGSCGSCWAFTSTAVFESYLAITANQLYDLSEEYVLECTSGSDCTGGFIGDALRLIQRRGIPEESKFPYKGQNSSSRTPSTSGICSTNLVLNTANPYTVYQSYQNSARTLKQVLAWGPIGVAISAEDFQFNSYSSGVLSCPTQKTTDDLNHAVTLIGYDSSNSWIIKNSWGSYWGENGFGYINQDYSKDCGIRFQAYRLYAIRSAVLTVLAVIIAILSS